MDGTTVFRSEIFAAKSGCFLGREIGEMVLGNGGELGDENERRNTERTLFPVL